MGKRGPAPKPTVLRVLHGDRKDQINDTEPQPAASEVTVPEDLSDDARAIWDQLAPDLVRVGVLTTWDVPAFVMVCEALARYRQATKLVDGSALLVALTKSRSWAHHGNPVAEWCFDAVEVRHPPGDADQLRPDKPDRAAVGRRIDAVSTAAMAVTRWRELAAKHARQGRMVVR